jgi:selenocysteine-specific elongation factor
MTVLATAGHVDHGKSTLVNFLTGQETDRLKEEKPKRSNHKPWLHIL